MERRTINPWPWTEHYGVAQGVEITGASRTVLCSGQIAVDADGQPLHVGDMKAQVKQALDNLETVLRRADMTFSDVVRLNAYTTDMDAFVAEVAEGGELFMRLKEARCCPVLTGVGVTRLAFPELMIEIEATAMK
jgi:enamine deaminase RidA (YjgF/YER057c/UK114 family)